MNAKIEKKSKKIRGSLARNEKGLSTVEYIIILILIAVAGIGLWQTFGGHLTRLMGDANAEMETL